MTCLYPRPRLLVATALAALWLSPVHALFDNSCLIFNIASRDYPMAEGWLAESTFPLSAKKMSAAQIRNLHYSLADKEAAVVTGENPNTTYFMVDGEIRFIHPDEQPSGPASSDAKETEAKPTAETTTAE
ncbi:MAG: hypothetical protein Q7Q73_04790 [Verrucomicrobiota bacterium JB024]|nr:hypothetical protein [Verrucomicrobiota bacterium JB024]